MPDSETTTAESTTMPPPSSSGTRLVNNPSALLALLSRLKASNDNVAFRTSGGLRVMIRNDPDSDVEDLMFDVSVIIEDESPSIVKAVKNEVDIMEDDAGVIILEEYSFPKSDGDALKGAMDFLNALDAWTVCPCGEYLVKDKYLDANAASMCYYCELTRGPTANDDDVYCPICMNDGCERWMVATECCKQKMHRRCREECIATSHLRNNTPECPLCRSLWAS